MASPYIDARMALDGNGNPVQGLYPFMAKKTITFAGATTNAWGDDGGTKDGGVVFTVTGVVKCVVIGKCTTSCTGAGSTDEVGITGDTAIFMPITTMTSLDTGHIWLNNATPATYFIAGESEAAADNLPVYILNGNDIILTTKTANTDTGVVELYCYWTPLSSDGSVVASSI